MWKVIKHNIGEMIKKKKVGTLLPWLLLYIPTVEYYAAIKNKEAVTKTSPVVQWLGFCTPCVGGPDPVSGQGTGYHMLQLGACMLQLKTSQLTPTAVK